ncbi:MAG TPA: hypothetical protein PLQ39_13245 [Acinetobacter sp.]|nr:hypothetical protein [Acinetobacter sp.]
MILIPVVLVDSILKPSEPIPTNAVRVVCDGTNYTVYEQGDELPPELVYDEQL